MHQSPREYLDPADLEHFNLQADPFDDIDDPEMTWTSPALDAIEAGLRAVITRRSIAAVHAPPGAGKTTLINRLGSTVTRQKSVRLIRVASPDRSTITHTTLAVAILRDLLRRDTSSMSGEQRGELLRTTLQEQVIAVHHPVVLIDEAHHMKSKALLAIKHIWDSHAFFRCLSFILVGHDTMRDGLASDPAVREVYGRTRFFSVPKLDERQTAAYIRWRFARVGGDADTVFTPAAYQALAQRGEHPLWIGNLAVSAMRYAAERAVGKVDHTIILSRG